jgi:hypothetical protein
MPQFLAALEAVAAAHQPALDHAVAALDDGNIKTRTMSAWFVLWF